MRRLLFLALAVTLVATLAILGCSQPAAAPTAAPAAPPKAAAAAPTAAPKAAAAAPTKAPVAAAPTSAPKISYPEKGKSIQWMVPFSAGGGADIATRVFASLLEKELGGTSIEILNKPGAITQAGVTELVRAKPDGYYLGTTPIPSILVPMLNKDTGATYTLKDIVPIANFASSDNVFAVRADSPFKTMKDVIDYAKANPGKVTVGDAGIMSNTNLISLAIARETGVKFASVHFGGGGEVTTAMLGGHVDVGVPSGADILTHVKAGKARVLATAGVKQSPIFPDVKNLNAQGFKSSNAYLIGFSAPAGTPKAIVDILGAAAQKVTASQAMIDKAKTAGFEVEGMGTAEYTKFVADYANQVAPLIELAKAEAK